MSIHPPSLEVEVRPMVGSSGGFEGVRSCSKGGRGKSGLQRIAQGLTTFRRKARNSGTERMSRAMSPMSVTRYTRWETSGELLE